MIFCISIVSKNQINKAKILKRSLERFGHKLTLLTTYDKRIGNMSKIIKLNDYFQQNDYNDDDVIAFVDAFDVVATSDPTKLKEYLDIKDVDIVVSTEQGFGRQPLISKSYYESYVNTVPTRSLCAGMMFGRANKLKQLFKNMSEKYSEYSKELYKPDTSLRIKNSDQYYFAYYLFKIDFKTYKDIKIMLDCNDDVLYTNTNDKIYTPSDYVFIHTWGLSNAKQYIRYRNLLKNINLI